MCSQESSRRPPGPTARSERAWPSPRGPRLLRSAGEVGSPVASRAPPRPRASPNILCFVCDIMEDGPPLQCGIFTGMSPEAKSNAVTLRIKYGIIPKKSGKRGGG